MELSQDFREWLACLNATKTDYVVVGGHALAHHGCPRFTGDIDVLVKPSTENAARVLEALRAFGFGSLDITIHDLDRVGRVIQLGFPRSASTYSRASTDSPGTKRQQIHRWRR